MLARRSESALGARNGLLMGWGGVWILFAPFLGSPPCRAQAPPPSTAQSSKQLPAVLTPGPTIAPEGVSALKLEPGSMVDVHVFEEPDLDGTYRMDAVGNISLPLAGTVRLDSLTLREAESAIGAQLIAQEILKVSHVVVNINEYGARDIVVLGEVNSPARYPVLVPRRLAEVLAMAGGRTSFAGNEIVIHRSGQPPVVTESVHYGRDTEGYIGANIEINPGDSIQVKRAGIVYVLGAVNRPGGYPMQEAGDLNIIQALAMAFGTAPEAANGRIRIIRKQSNGVILEIPVSYGEVTKGQLPAMELQSQDIVFVPSSKIKSLFIDGKSVISATAAATVYTLR
jgi:polysaccharide export outer membrane protein